MKKHIISFTIILVMLIFGIIGVSFAADINVSVSNDNPKPGEQVTVTIDSSYFVLEGTINASSNLTLDTNASTANSIGKDNLFMVDEGQPIKLVYTVNSNAKPGEAINFSFSNLNSVNSNMQESAVNAPSAISGTVGGKVTPTKTPAPTRTSQPVQTQQPTVTSNPIPTYDPSILGGSSGQSSSGSSSAAIGNGWEALPTPTSLTPSATQSKKPSNYTGTSSNTDTSSKKPPKTADATPIVWAIGLSAMAGGSILTIFTIRKMLAK